jgi:hypothetical protein
VKWVLSELVAMLSAASINTGKKHPLEETSKTVQRSKKCVSFLLYFIIIHNYRVNRTKTII